jgi:beta-galactosidase
MAPYKPQRHSAETFYNVVKLCFVLSLWSNSLFAQRTDILLNSNWQTIASDSNQNTYAGFESVNYNTKHLRIVNVPHNWDAYDGYRRLLHGNKHGYAWYKKSFTATKKAGKRYFLFFEGVGSYATVWLNGKQVGYHAGGRTSFTIDVTDYLVFNKQNQLAVRADHPANIKDLPWVCGGCSDERGFSEGSQPMGIFRPVHLIITNQVRIEPFGVHVWNDENVSEKSASLSLQVEVKNYGRYSSFFRIDNKVVDNSGKIVASSYSIEHLYGNQSQTFSFTISNITNVHLWDIENPYLYKVVTTVTEKGKAIDETIMPYGIRSIKWDRGNSNRFFLNGKPVFINGIAEYEHLLGQSHAFTSQQITSRVNMVKQLGFNAFRDAHQPHNLQYQNAWDSLGILWWTQLSAHVWYDTKAFRDNFKTLLKEWVIERRNSPSVILWGLQNESKLPADFAKECTELIRSLDPTASSQRLVTTCNGGEGTDWDVPQNWTGTYGGNPNTYNEDVKKQVLIGEYGAWRTLDLHTEGGFTQNGALSEDRMTQLMETKIRLAEQVKDSAAGHFFWLLTSHDNPGRMQGGEGLRELDRIGPVNYKGLLTPWEEPTDAYYMFKSNYASKVNDPMVYIVSHTWPNRWTTAGKKDGIIVYSNCDEVELFNDINHQSLGKQQRKGIGTHFQWDAVDINHNVLYAVGYVNGKAVTKDVIILQNLPKAPHFSDLYSTIKNITKPQENYHYIYRVNCGGSNYNDFNGNTWLADRALINHKSSITNHCWFSSSWTNDFAEMPAFFASQRRTFSPIASTTDWPLFQSFRYGRNKLKYSFPVPDGEYLVELYFVEPWLGIGSRSDSKGMRLFDVAINNKIVLRDVDIWTEVGTNAALKKTVKAKIIGGKLEITFPNVAAGQAVISALAIASLNKHIQPAPSVQPITTSVNTKQAFDLRTWCDIGEHPFLHDSSTFTTLPSNIFGVDYLALEKNSHEPVSFSLSNDADVFVAVDVNSPKPLWLNGFEDTRTFVETNETNNSKFLAYKKRCKQGDIITLNTDSEQMDVLVFVSPANNMQPAYDLKPVIGYRPSQASTTLDAIKTTVNTKESITLNSNSASIKWPVSIGAADVYSLTLRYANETNTELTATLELVAADGTSMKKELLHFSPSKIGKWNYVTTNTGSMINAGNYFIIIKAQDAVGLSISALDIQ